MFYSDFLERATKTYQIANRKSRIDQGYQQHTDDNDLNSQGVPSRLVDPNLVGSAFNIARGEKKEKELFEKKSERLYIPKTVEKLTEQHVEGRNHWRRTYYC